MGDQTVNLELLYSAFFDVKQLMNLFRIYSLGKISLHHMELDVGIVCGNYESGRHDLPFLKLDTHYFHI